MLAGTCMKTVKTDKIVGTSHKVLFSNVTARCVCYSNTRLYVKTKQQTKHKVQSFFFFVCVCFLFFFFLFCFAFIWHQDVCLAYSLKSCHREGALCCLCVSYLP